MRLKQSCAKLLLLLLVVVVVVVLLLLILAANGFLPGGSGNTRTHNK
jgi:hypothetical protein